jgi:predicted metalloprotease with PDZ domain
MRWPIAFLLTCGPGWLLAALIWWMPATRSWALDVPAKSLSALLSDEFRIRETAQAELLAWARQQPEQAMDALFRVSRTHDDPEVRERCLAVLRELVNDEYLKEGEGFLGIRMQDEKALVPGEQKPRSVIRVIQVVPDSAALQAGVQLNDLITGLDDNVWQDEAALLPFMNHIRQLKPGNRVKLRILRNGKMIDLPVKLGRRPLLADNPFLDQRQRDVDAAERAAKEAYFRRWLERRKARD